MASSIQAEHFSAALYSLLDETTEWPSEREIGGAIAMIVHTAYHLGEIRQALCMIKK